jgi:hypothetical protein
MDDMACDWEKNDRRQHCELVIALNQKFDDHCKRFNDFLEETKIYRSKNEEWQLTVDENLGKVQGTIKDFINTYKAILKVLGFIGTTVVIVTTWWKFIVKHVFPFIFGK